MAFWITSAVPFKPLGDYDIFKKRAIAIGAIKDKNVIQDEVFKKVSTLYAISPDPKDYHYLSCLAVRVGVPNLNGDAVSKEELFKFRPARKCRSYETFINSPLHINHFSSDPKLAKGFIVDAVYNDWEEDFEFIETVVAVDKKKDPILAKALIEGRINKFSMGSMVEALQCSLSFCKKIAYKESDLCEHLRANKLQKINNELCFEWNIGVEYEELSIVENPAEKMAMTRRVFANVPLTYTVLNNLSAQRKANFYIGASVQERIKWADVMGISEKELEVIAEFIKTYKNRLPDTILKVLGKVFMEIG